MKLKLVYWILVFPFRVKLNWLTFYMGYAILGIGCAIAKFPEGEFDENISELISYLTSGMHVAIIRDVDLHRCRHPLDGTSKQLNGIEAQRLRWSRFLMPKIALDNLNNSGKLLRLSSKGVVVKKYGAPKQQNSAIADIERLSRWGRFFRLYCTWCGCNL